MFVAAGKIVLDYYNNDSLRLKKKNLDELMQSVRHKFNASASEVADFDDLEKCVIGVSMVASTEKSARAAIKKLLDFVDGSSFARVVVEDVDVFSYD